MITGIVLVHVDPVVITVAVERVAGFMMEAVRSAVTVATMVQALVCFFTHFICG